MKRPFIIGNWKSYKSVREVEEWFASIMPLTLNSTHAEVVVCPPFPLLSLCRQMLQKYNLHWQLGAQNVSAFPEGKHTGEVNAKQLKDFVAYVLIGHSERRQEYAETDEILFEKTQRVLESGLTPIFFVQGEETPIPENIGIVAYEPIFAVGTGHPDTPEDAEKVAHYFKTVRHVPVVLYGGSVDDKNVAAFMSCSFIDGIVPGTASLDPVVFTHLINNA